VWRDSDGFVNHAAARALALGDPLGALKRVALRDDAPALALRGIAMAQLGDLVRAKACCDVPRARSVRERRRPREVCRRRGGDRARFARFELAPKALDAARATLDAHGDRVNAAHARYLEVRRLVLIGQLDEAERLLSTLDPTPLPPASMTAHQLVVAGIAIRRLRTKDARAALERAGRSARRAGIAALIAEVENAALVLTTPAARLTSHGEQRLVGLEEVEALLASNAFVVDAWRHVVRDGRAVVSLASRPVLFALVRALGEAWPGDVARDALIARAFGGKHADESHRARLRVEVGRLRTMLRSLADVRATQRGFALAPRRARQVVVLARPVDDEHAAVLAFLADGEAWSSSALALALGASQRTVQRALDSLAADGKVQSCGRGRARRWMMPPVPGFTTTLLLPAPLPTD
jgi:hypothetical protein